METSSPLAGLSGERRAAILVVLLGREVSAELLKHLSKRDVARIAREVADLGTVTSTPLKVLTTSSCASWRTIRPRSTLPSVSRTDTGPLGGLSGVAPGAS